mmetsp:Transcript_29791/g.41658  ORF Transcript_29791/g.41658 Transcript_29791/m.41658 type:complete len:179 (+) Transcript_29791:60-596(+)|eukprot:CAMPEP_0175093334 /NCGR_PEP_ID=MMETSP0086_2-20121207/2955_1 /TAXON_ID=136419 /ORGANISM="Unknown Unknown, Strain D1" /LENGTH=178 /DNA_ID=CAMNT_0016366285 /DNA_START=60 /DNA_END=596 /DNA_ORIENTATION=-
MRGALLVFVSLAFLSCAIQVNGQGQQTQPVEVFEQFPPDLAALETDGKSDLLADVSIDDLEALEKCEKPKDATTALCIWMFTAGAFTDFYLGFVARGFAKIFFGLTPIILWVSRWLVNYGCCYNHNFSVIDVVKEISSVCWVFGFFNILCVAWNMYDFAELPFSGVLDSNGCALTPIG